MNIFGVIHVSALCWMECWGMLTGASQRYLTIKDMTPEERKKVNPKVVFFAGKAAPGCEYADRIIVYNR